ncbi:MAG: hypothetical protein A3I78_11770 [Gammaproteobacteria bacterium RIFCSPLOWO2_02_FULL_56_15]|nr:MAG: hypothetical protein A3I78_11770 [Gammaproteobacteria bacterium RIFCSPLOWO2_02_FULL_56_15]
MTGAELSIALSAPGEKIGFIVVFFHPAGLTARPYGVTNEKPLPDGGTGMNSLQSRQKRN